MPSFLEKKDFVAKGWIPLPTLVSHEVFCDHGQNFLPRPKNFGVDFQSFQTDPVGEKTLIGYAAFSRDSRQDPMLENANVVDARGDVVALNLPLVRRACWLAALPNVSCGEKCEGGEAEEPALGILPLRKLIGSLNDGVELKWSQESREESRMPLVRIPASRSSSSASENHCAPRMFYFVVSDVAESKWYKND